MTHDDERLPPGFDLLELEGNASVQAVRRAYALRVKAIDQAAEPQAFQQLRAAYEAAIEWCEHREPDDPPTVAALADDQVAWQAFRELAAAAWSNADHALARLTALLDKPALQAIEVRRHFERMLVRQLAAGWQPGHEWLFEAAVVGLAWDLDPDRLRLYGEPGAILSGAVHERDRFEAQVPRGRHLQLDLMERIRAGKRPSDTDLVRTFRVLNWLMSNFGQWMAITVGARNVARWDGWHDALPPGRHAADAPHPEPTHAPEWLGVAHAPPSPMRTGMMRLVRGALLLTFVLMAALWLWSLLLPTH